MQAIIECTEDKGRQRKGNRGRWELVKESKGQKKQRTMSKEQAWSVISWKERKGREFNLGIVKDA